MQAILDSRNITSMISTIFERLRHEGWVIQKSKPKSIERFDEDGVAYVWYDSRSLKVADNRNRFLFHYYCDSHQRWFLKEVLDTSPVFYRWEDLGKVVLYIEPNMTGTKTN